MLMQSSWYSRLALLTTLLALCVIILGAYTRIKDAGLGCPDWPGCYGQLTVPETSHALAKAEQAFPGHTVEAHKAWPEMIHRYFAGTLATLVLILTALGIWQKRKLKLSLGLLLALAFLIIFQAMLGMWTVTLKLLPVVVMGHLLGGLTLAALLWGLTLQTSGWLRQEEFIQAPSFRPWVILGIVILALQIFLGGWTSANYAGIACPDFPFCYGNLWPAMDFNQAFQFWMPVGIDYQGGSLTEEAKITIQMMHRLGALVTTLYLGFLSLRLILDNYSPAMRKLSALLLVLLLIQISLGILNVLLKLPLHVAVSHNAVAVLLLLTLVTINFHLYAKKMDELP
ncbi:MAG: hypothetical protein K0S11_828 [Gammaproteobacteria bacterium]|jgi:cytochrome c oxidase assembly protein subunit 15|nr:hypothetical protein [Gammaproteobacteria bacterium]